MQLSTFKVRYFCYTITVATLCRLYLLFSNLPQFDRYSILLLSLEERKSWTCVRYVMILCGSQVRSGIATRPGGSGESLNLLKDTPGTCKRTLINPAGDGRNGRFATPETRGLRLMHPRF